MVFLRKIMGPFREFGWIAGGVYALDRVLRAMSPGLRLYFYEFMAQPIKTLPKLPQSLLKNLSFGEITPGCEELRHMPARPEIISSRFNQGAICLGAYYKGVLSAYIWFCFQRYAEDEAHCTYELAEPETTVFDFDLYVLPEYRMGIAFPGLWYGAGKYLEGRGIRYTCSRMTRFNLASRNAHLRMGSKRIGQAIFFQAWRVQLLLATIPPFLSLTWNPQSPRILLSTSGIDAAAGVNGSVL